MQARTTKQLRRRDTEIHRKGIATSKMLGLGKGFMVIPCNGRYYKIEDNKSYHSQVKNANVAISLAES
jgi:hypothetical protein